MPPKQTTKGFVYIRYELICQLFNCPGIGNEMSQLLCVSTQRIIIFFQDLHATGSQCATSFLNVIENYLKKKKKESKRSTSLDNLMSINQTLSVG